MLSSQKNCSFAGKHQPTGTIVENFKDLILQRFNDYIEKHHLIEPGSKVLLAVSGGMDSVSMCHFFHQSGIEFGIAHCNFKLRGNDADQDSRFTKNLASDLQVPFFSVEFDTKKTAAERKISIQVAARDLRYEWMEKIRAEHKYRSVATAHHTNDSLETFMINFVRGSGIKGLMGIPIKNDHIIRPLLCFTREEIEQWVMFCNIKYREDATNQEVKYTRNKIRHQVVPVLKEINPGIYKSFRSVQTIFEQTDDLIRHFIKEISKKAVSKHQNKILIQIDKVLEYPSLPLILYELLNPYGFNPPIVQDISKHLKSQPGKLFYSPTHTCLLDRDVLIVEPADHKTICKEERVYTIQENTLQIMLPDGILEGEKKTVPVNTSFITQPNEAYFDAKTLSFPLIVRHPQKGDYFYPLGLSGKKKISDLLTDLKIPRTQKQNVWLVTSGEQIIWVMGYRTDNRFRCKKNTKQFFHFKFTKQT